MSRGVTVDRAHPWDGGTQTVRYSDLRIGRLAHVGPAWEGWTLSPEGDPVTLGVFSKRAHALSAVVEAAHLDEWVLV